MPRILTGIQSSGKPHLGNVLGAIQPALEASLLQDEAAFFFIADLHSLTTVQDAALLRQNTWAVAAAWLACGLDVEKDVFYRQSQIPEVTELAWYLGCFAPYPMLANAHSFKDKQDNLPSVSAGLFTYPVLMAADIALYDAHLVPVGRDQIQHLEMTRDMVGALNRNLGQTVLVLPEARIRESVQTLPGTDGRKMSKSYGNTIDIFAPEKTLRKAVMGIKTDSTPIEDPKDPDTCTVVKLYRTVANPEAVATMEAQYRAGGYGYGAAKQTLFEALLDCFAEARARYAALEAHPKRVEEALRVGEAKARPVAQATLARLREAFGYGARQTNSQ
jgi:tryptophanyl-tRNA synthetase